MFIIYSYIILYDVAATLKHVAKTVAHVDLSDHIIQVVYTIFDENSELIFINRNTVCINRLLRKATVYFLTSYSINVSYICVCVCVYFKYIKCIFNG